MGRDVLIVGGGIVGLCTAHYAAERGLRVTVVDRASPTDDGCSFGNVGMIVPSHVVPLAAPGMVSMGLRYMLSPESPFYVRPRPSLDLLRWGVRFWRAANARHVARAAPVLRDLHLASRACFEDLARTHDIGLVQRGLLMLCRTAHGLAEETRAAEHARSLGVPADVLGPSEAQALEPEVRLDVTGAVHYPLDCHLTPARLMAALRESLERSSVRFVWNASVTGWRKREGRVEAAITSQGELAADEFVLAAGVWSVPVARDLGLSLPMQAGKGYSLTLPAPRRLPALCAILSEARVAVTPMGGALRVGGTMELTGIDTTVDERRVRGIAKAVPQYLPDFAASDFEGVPAWCGLRPCSPDGLPYVGRTHRFRNLSIATGHSMMGVSLAPITGRLVADVLSGTDALDRLARARPGPLFMRNRTVKLDWRGVIPAITTPFNEDLRVDHGFLADHARWMVDGGCIGIVPIGSLGEGATLTAEREAPGARDLRPRGGGPRARHPRHLRAVHGGGRRSGPRRAADRLPRAHGAAAVRVQHRLARDARARGRRPGSDRPAVPAVQQPRRVPDGLHARAGRGPGRLVSPAGGRQGVEHRRPPRHRHPRAPERARARCWWAWTTRSWRASPRARSAGSPGS